MTPDLIMGLFEVVGSLFTCFNVWRVWRDKRVMGVSLWPTGFFIVWGLWNLYYYPHLDQWWAFWGGVVMTLSNIAWLSLAIRYRK